ncbi:MAG: chromosome segregation protein SMC [Ignavibacteriales bacterium]|nr:chromosome segregation protein SMC [Ignavibacteriales bacterium]
MYLSSLEVIGFKSFAQRIDVKFDTGVTAIVGPNGCGKTNIVDAIRWVLGEQKYSTLRSDKMEDVIFNGTRNRRALGMAEVSLIIENSKGILPTEYSQVTVSRRVYRSGESEYLLNKVQCRLKDILDLFMDTGMGPDAYSVIELKMVETILSETADERRRLFEEAAGVTKYKHRRKAAYRKLDEVRVDLSRVNDIVKEVQKTVNQLERQARKAEQYNDVATRLEKIEIELLERQYSGLHKKLEYYESQFTEAKSRRSQLQQTLDVQETQVDDLRTNLRDIEQRMSEVQRIVTQQREQLHKQEEGLLVAKERRNSLSSNIERYEIEKIDLRTQREKLEQEQYGLQTKNERLSKEFEESKLAHVQAQTERDSASKEFEAIKSEVQSLNEQLLQLAHNMVEKRGEHERLRTKIDNSKGRIDRSQEEIELYQQGVLQREELITKLTLKDRELRRLSIDSEKELLEQEREQVRLKRDIESLQMKSLELQNEIDKRTEKIAFLQGFFETSEGTIEGAKYLLQQEHWQKRNLLSVTDVFETDDRYQFALEAALGEMTNLLIVEHERDAHEAIDELLKHKRGKATFVCLERVPVLHHIKEVNDESTLFYLKDVVRCEEKYRSLVELLLDDVALVESVEKANDVFANHIGIQCVTPEGQLVSSAGFVRGGSHKAEVQAVFGKKTKTVEIEQEIVLFQKELESVLEQLQQYNDLYNSLDTKELAAQVKSVGQEMTQIEMQIAQVVFENKHAQAGINRHQQEQESLQSEITSLIEQDARALDELQLLDRKKSETEASSVKAQNELEIVERLFKEKAGRTSQLSIKVVTMQGELSNVVKELERVTKSLSDNSTTFARREDEISRAKEEIAQLTGTVETQSLEIGKLQNELEAHEREREEIEKVYATKRDEVHRIELKLKDERRAHEDAVSSSHEFDMKQIEVRGKIDHIKRKADEEFEIKLELKEFEDATEIDIALLEDEVKTLKERKKTLGAINFEAFDEYQSESERLTFLSQQRDDLIEAEQTLIKTIDEINTTAQNKFLETFSRIRENFITIFKELFDPGDECDLRLQEDADPLEANIEIIAKPRGKRPTSIDLLSGGEKTLTAISLLFAIYLVKPSPFCILDEVDAPLDDSNIDRYTRMIKKFSNNTQFIVVTHNKRTMEAAQALYGVTMEEEGVSKLVTVRFNEQAKVGSATVASGVTFG